MDPETAIHINDSLLITFSVDGDEKVDGVLLVDTDTDEMVRLPVVHFDIVKPAIDSMMERVYAVAIHQGSVVEI